MGHPSESLAEHVAREYSRPILSFLAGKVSSAEDAEDLAAFRSRKKEPALAFEAVVRDLKRRGKL